jgi:hypothetical protein
VSSLGQKVIAVRRQWLFEHLRGLDENIPQDAMITDAGYDTVTQTFYISVASDGFPPEWKGAVLQALTVFE